MIPVTCDLTGGSTVIFDVEDTEQEDDDETYLMYEMFQRLVGA